MGSVKYTEVSNVNATYDSNGQLNGLPGNQIESSMDDDKSSVSMLQDGGQGQFIKPTKVTDLAFGDSMSEYAKHIYHPNGIFSERELDIYNQTYRFGFYNTNTLGAGREYLFFTKPDLNIARVSGNLALQDYFQGIPFWMDLIEHRPQTIIALQNSIQLRNSNNSVADPFNHLLQNQCISSLSVPSLTSQMTETPVNDYGVGYNYRGSSESSDDNPEFSLEFKDNRWLDTYLFFKAYEYYETMKHHGQCAPDQNYIFNRIIHDAFAIYKFIVAEDMETIIYYGKMYGVTPKSLPRDTFDNATFDNGITYSIDFQAAFYEDMIPDIITDFNALSREFYYSNRYQIDVYNDALGTIDGRAAKAAMVFAQASSKSPSKMAYKLRWRGSEKV